MSATVATRRAGELADIITAIEKIFPAHFGGPSWQSWRVFLKALFALPLADDELEVYRHHTERTSEPLEPFRETALVVGRRGGKSRVLALVAVFLAAFRDYSPYLGAGEIATVVIIAANRMQARSIFRYTLGLLEAAPVLARMIKDASADQISDGPYEVLRARLWAQCRASFAGVACRRFSINSAD